MKIETDQDILNVYVTYKPVATYIPARTDQFFAILMSMCRVNLSQDFNPVSVRFVHPAPPCAGDFFAYFRAPVTFDAEINCLALPSDHVDLPLQGYNPELLRLHDEIMVRHLVQLGQDDIVHRVQSVILDMLPSGQISDEKAARRINMSVRSLQRSLKKKATTFGTLLDGVRRELADDYVRDPNMALAEIAFVLGFSEQSAFTRAFKRWTGVTPGRFREEALGHASPS
jgi:AraC-like DNA-binding protein